MTIKIGDSASLTKRFHAEEVKLFSELSLDKNPVHLNSEYASTTRFKRRIVHGILVSGLISAVLGNKLPGPGVIYLQQNLSFKRPVYIDDLITASVEVTNIRTDKPIITLKTNCTNEKGKIVIEGEAVLLMEE